MKPDTSTNTVSKTFEGENRILRQNRRRTHGRPRSEQSRVAILKAAYYFLKKQSVADISTHRIAQEAGVSPATIYRWWPAKEPLLVDAFLYEHGSIPVSSAGSPLESLKQYVMKFGKFVGGSQGVALARVIAAIQDRESLRDAFIKRMFQYSQLQEVIEEAARRGELPREINAVEFTDMLISPIFIRLLLGHQTISKAFVLSTYEHVLAGANIKSSMQNAKNKGRR